MLKLENITKGAQLCGLLPEEIVRVVSVDELGPDARKAVSLLPLSMQPHRPQGRGLGYHQLDREVKASALSVTQHRVLRL